MRTLITAVLALAFAGCGRLDETLSPATTETQASLTNAKGDDMPLPEVGPQPEEWRLVWTLKGLELKLVQGPVEERFFYRVDVNTPPPTLPPPPCPACR